MPVISVLFKAWSRISHECSTSAVVPMLILSAKIVLFFELCKFLGASLSEIVGIYRKLSEIIGRTSQIPTKCKRGSRMSDDIGRN